MPRYSLQPGPGNSSSSPSPWGVAFRDLKSAGTLYPAIAMYYRHDEVMIKRVPPSQVCATCSAVGCKL
jgi:hypothetical protein